MKKYMAALVLALIFLGGCRAEHKKILGTWVNFDYYYGLEELTFFRDDTARRADRRHNDEDEEEIIPYKIIDTKLIMDGIAYNYAVSDNKLFLSDLRGGVIYLYTRKNTKNINAIKKNLTGTWLYSSDNERFEMTFMKDGTSRIKYTADRAVPFEETYPFEITGNFLTIKEFDRSYGYPYNPYIKNGIFIYQMDRNYLYISECPSGEIVIEPVILTRQTK